MSKLFGLGVSVLVLTACGPEARVLDNVPPSESGKVSCEILCQFEEDNVVFMRANTGPCEEGKACATCQSCLDLLDYHAANFSCDDGTPGLRQIPLQFNDEQCAEFENE